MTEPSPGETLRNLATGAGVGAALGGAVVAGAFRVAGLTFRGPVAGGWFASNMGAELKSGSNMSRSQSAAMTPGAYLLGAGILAVAGGVYAFYNYEAKEDTQEPIDSVQLADGEPMGNNNNEGGKRNENDDSSNDPTTN